MSKEAMHQEAAELYEINAAGFTYTGELEPSFQFLGVVDHITIERQFSGKLFGEEFYKAISIDIPVIAFSCTEPDGSQKIELMVDPRYASAYEEIDEDLSYLEGLPEEDPVEINRKLLADLADAVGKDLGISEDIFGSWKIEGGS